jgi:HAD superfamily hydrolase (TIGR01509 family)
MKAVIFDMDGVIFDSERLVIECWEIAAARHGIQNVEAACRMSLGQNAAQAKANFKQVYGQDFPYDTYKAEMSALYHERVDEGALRLKSGIVELLTYLKQENYKIGLASSTRRLVVEKEIGAAGLTKWFDDILCGDAVTKSKPEPDIYLLSCKRLGVLPEEAYGIEDSYNGMRAIYRAGMKPIMVPDLVEPDEEMKSIAYWIFPSLVEVKEFLQQRK